MEKPRKTNNISPAGERSGTEVGMLLAYFRQNSEGIAISDLNGRMLFVNRAFAGMHGYHSGELRGRNLTVFHSRRQLPNVMSSNQILKQTGHFLGEIWHRRKDGTVFPGAMRNLVIRDINGKPMYMVGTLRDITEKKLLEEKLRESEQRLKIMADITSAGIMIFQGDKIVYANRAMQKGLGYSGKEFATMNFWDFIHPDYQKLLKQRGRVRQRRSRPSRRYELKVVTKKGEIKWVDLCADTAIFHGKSAGIVTAVDITKSKQLKNALERLVRERTSKLEISTQRLQEEIAERKKAQETLERRNIALKELLEILEVEKSRLKRNFSANLEQLLLPSLTRLRRKCRDGSSRMDGELLDLLELDIKNLTSSFGCELSKPYPHLTPREIEICSMIKNGSSNKCIASLLGISCRTVERHRDDIRKKLSINHRKIPLAPFLKYSASQP
jgi:PAS domain S-box-containing protein